MLLMMERCVRLLEPRTSTTDWEPVVEWMVVKFADLTPNSSMTSFNMGAMQLVVQEEAETMFCPA